MNTKTKKEILVICEGLNELGVKESNEHYRPNIEHYGVEKFPPIKLGSYSGVQKRFKNVKSFYKKGLENYLFTHECTQYRKDGIGLGPSFSFKLKHFNIKIYEVNITETYDKVNL